MAFKPKLTACLAIVALSLPMGALAEDHASADTVVATVNGTDITLGHMIILKQRLPQQYQQLPPEDLFQGILDQLVQQTLLGGTVDALSRGTRMTLENEERAIWANEAIKGIIDAAGTDEALQEAYQETFGSADPEPEYNASHILVKTEDEARALIEELNAGAEFAALAREKSAGPSGPRGGELGWFGKGAMVAPFEEAVLALEVGAISAPVETQFGWHVIRLNDTRLANAPALEEVRGDLLQVVQRKALDARLKELEAAADVTRKTAEEIDPALLNETSLLDD